MNKDCNDCDNKTDGKCCHEAIRARTELVGDEISIGRELAHYEATHGQRWRFKPMPLNQPPQIIESMK